MYTRRRPEFGVASIDLTGELHAELPSGIRRVVLFRDGG
jgi:hypothetical protein